MAKSTLLTFFLLILTSLGFSQNIVYIKKLNDISNFASGNGEIEIFTHGLNPNIQLSIEYSTMINGNLTSTGLIPITSNIIANVAGGMIYIVGSFQGSNLLDFSYNINGNYEIASVNSSGFDSEGNWLGGNWTVDLTFDGPDLLCDATSWGENDSQASNNQLLINGSTSMGALVQFNGFTSYFGIFVEDLNTYEANIPTGTLLNAVVPRVQNRPTNASDCSGIVELDLISAISDLELMYAVNNSNFQIVTQNQIGNLCGNDTLMIIGFSDLIAGIDTICKTQYLVRSQENFNANYYDLSFSNIILNDEGEGSRENNKLTFSSISQEPGASGLAVLEYENGYYFDFVFDYDPGWEDYVKGVPQGKYNIIRPNPTENGYYDFFTITILNENNQYSEFSKNYDVTISNNDTNACSVNFTVTDDTPSTSNIINIIDYTPELFAGGPDSQFQGFYAFSGAYSSDTSTQSFCKGLKSVQYEGQLSKIFYATDSLQKIVSHYDYIYRADNYTNAVCEQIDTIYHYWEECTNDYNEPLPIVNFDKNVLIDNIYFSNFDGGFAFEKYECMFNFTQNGNTVSLPYRESIAEKSFSTNFNYVIVGELYCNDGQKSTEKRRKIILNPDGSIEDVYSNASLSINQNSDKEQILVSPNPLSDFLHLKSPQIISYYKMTNINGETILEQKLNSNAVKIETSQLKSGIYFIEVISNNTTSNHKVIKL